jgi:predicted lactoylglutathione lyase
MPKRIFVNLPVTDVARSTAFYTALGFERNAAFSNERASAMSWSDTIHVMLLAHDFYATFTPKPIGDAHATSMVLIALSLDSRAEVDAITQAAIAAGGREAHPPEDEGFMYSCAFEDPDGHGFGPFWMDMAAMPAQPVEAEKTA